MKHGFSIEFRSLFFLIFILVIMVSPIAAEEADSVRYSNIEEFTVEAKRVPEWKPVFEINAGIIDKYDGVSIAELASLIPSSKVQTNSRGETTLFLRGAGERQIVFLFDGVPLNVPWDNRIDLNLIPAEAVDKLTVTKGIPSVIYGANAISGVVNIHTNSLQNHNNPLKIVGRLSDVNTGYFSGTYESGHENIAYLITSSYETTGGFKLPTGFSHPENESSVRINSGRASLSFFGKLHYRYSSNGWMRISTSFIDAKKEVPPEMDVSNPRYWRYPLWRHVSLAVAGERKLKYGAGSVMSFVFWGTHLESRIDQYDNHFFTQIVDFVNSKDITGGGRIVFSNMVRSTSLLTVSVAGLTTLHRENIFTQGSAHNEYSQNLLSLGAEYEYFWKNIKTLTGLSHDFSNIRLLGDNDLNNSIHDYSITGGIVYSLSPLYSINLSAGRKTRFPTLRESFSGALGRFVPNPDLKPETAYSFDQALRGVHGRGTFDLSFFLTYLTNGIVRESLPERQFRRVNKNVIRTTGFEFTSLYRLNSSLSATLQLSYLSALAKNDAGTFADTLEYKPNIIASSILSYNLTARLGSMLEVSYAGREYALREGSPYFRRLPEHVLVHFRFEYITDITGGAKLELFVRVNNLFDKLYYSQWGLPEAGRSFVIGGALEL